MKKIKITCLGLLALSLGFTSCQEDESLTRANNRPIASLDSASVTTTEGQPATFTLNLDKAIHDAVEFRVEVVGGTAVEGVDFNMDNYGPASIFEGAFGYLGAMSPYVTTQDFTINTIADIYPEETKTIELKFTSVLNAKGYIDDLFLTVNIENFVQPNDDVSIRLEWDDAASANGSFAGCDIDYDLEVYDGGFGLFADSYYDCPELIVIADTAPDGNYFVVPSLYDLGGTPDTAADAVNLPFKLVIYKAGIWYNEMDFNDPAFNSFDGVGAATLGAVLVKTGTSFELQDGNGDTISTGKMGLPQFTSSRK